VKMPHTGARESQARLGQGRSVPFGEADRELRRAWATVDEDSRRTDGEGMLRLREVNLVVVAGEQDLVRARLTAALAAAEHPGRVIVVAPGGTGSSASIATGCLIDGFSERRVCSEEVVVQGTHGEEEQLQAAVLQLLVPDLPVVGWWMGEITGAVESLPWLAGVTDQLVTDLGSAADPSASLKVLTELIADQPAVRLREMEWLRSASWRRLTAELFESPSRRLLAQQIQRVEVRHRDAPMQALLFAAWFAFRLGMMVGDGEWSSRNSTAWIRMQGSEPEVLEVGLGRDLEAVGDSAGFTRGLTGVTIHLGVEIDGSTPDEVECKGRSLAIMRLPHSLVCRCGTGDCFDAAVLKSAGAVEFDDSQLLSLVMDTPAEDRGFKEILRTALELSHAPGSDNSFQNEAAAP